MLLIEKRKVQHRLNLAATVLFIILAAFLIVRDSRPRGVFDPAVNGAQYRTLCDLTRRLFRSFDLQEVAFAYDDPMLEVVNVAGLELAALADKANARRTSL
jgi:hypothetical protein